jgi:hypothetical protein
VHIPKCVLSTSHNSITQTLCIKEICEAVYCYVRMHNRMPRVVSINLIKSPVMLLHVSCLVIRLLCVVMPAADCMA